MVAASADPSAAASCWSNRDAQFHSGQHDQHHHNDANDQRDDPGQDLRRRLRQLFRRQRHTVWRHWSKRNDLQRDQRGRTVPARDGHQISGHRRAAG
ncbi:MAG: hypothetical protein EBS81_12685, partial [Gammaproteobacteria bacterium]|nr:hypothetical protein [Gammaproteobacteria bacterium]